MSFETIASKIIENSIVSSLYIDDKVVEPFEELNDTNNNYYGVSKGLYSSFRAKNKSLDFYKFQLDKDWKQDSEYIFRNRDLLVLDWQLDDPKELRQSDTLAILQQAIETDSLHFVSIYTATEARHFQDIFYIIKAYFEIGFNAEAQRNYDNLIIAIENEGIDSSFINDLGARFKEIALNENNKNILNDLKQTLQKTLKDKYKFFAQCLKALNSTNTINACEIFGYCLNYETFNTNLSNRYGINFTFIKNNFILINQTIIQLTNKSDPKPIDHFEFFTNALLLVCGNPLTLASLEIRNLLRVSSGFIGNDADSINDAALFYHKSRKENFFKFIIDIWKSHTHSFVDFNSHKLISLNEDFWTQYENKNNLTEKLTSLMESGNEDKFHKELSKLNIYYNTLHILKLMNEKIRFGDIFICTGGNYKNDFFLNITAHCDCEEPKENLKNNFYFLIGKKGKLDEELKRREEGFNSYFKMEEELVAIKWGNRPVVLNVNQSEMIDFKVITKDGMQNDIPLMYKGTLKENYTQRMANNSFSFAMRVGIDFASI